jgi:hypothetical protein
MRLPGSHNTKNGDWLEVQIVHRNDERHDLETLCQWLSETRPFIETKSKQTNGAGTNNENPWLRLANEYGYKPPIDVEQRLAEMTYEGEGESAIHQTQLQLSASMLNKGIPTDEIVTCLIETTRAAAGRHGEAWNWRKEEDAIRKMCSDWIKKHPEIESPPIQPEAGESMVLSLDDWLARELPQPDFILG